MCDSRLIEMQTMTRQSNPRGQFVRGFSLIELMVSLTIGLVIAIAAMSAYLGASGASKMTDVQSRMNEDAQAALTILSQQLRMAGNNPKRANRVDNTTVYASSTMRNPVYYVYTTPTTTASYSGVTYVPATYTLSDFYIRGCDGTFNTITTTTSIDGLVCPSTASTNTNTVPDSIAITYEADKFNTVPTAAGLATNCLGSALDNITATLATFAGGTVTNAAVTYTVADNRFYIGTSSTIKSPSLYCKGSGSAAQPLVENIENLQFQYGTINATATSTTATVAGYLSAYDVLNATGLSSLSGDAFRWKKVHTVRICVVVRSELPAVSDAYSARYIDCIGNTVNAPDLRLRRAYSTTVVLRNRLYPPQPFP
jgi:type IV pilus assembly protein PilW